MNAQNDLQVIIDFDVLRVVKINGFSSIDDANFDNTGNKPGVYSVNVNEQSQKFINEINATIMPNHNLIGIYWI